MTNATHEPEIIEEEVSASLAIAGGQDIDIQVATARRFPRSITKFQQKALSMATLNTEVATSCIYALPRKDENGRQKNIEGPSARFAEIMASAWGNLRAEGKTIGDDGQYVTGRGTAWDVENNVAIAFEVQRRITNRHGQTYSADMIMVTGNASASIALRNAILKVVPTAFWKPIYNECRRTVAGDAKTFAARRDVMLKEFAVMGVTEERLFGAFGLNGKDDITLEHMATLRGFYTALKDGETTIEEAFPDGGGLGTAPKAGQRKSQQQNGAEGPQQREARSRETPSAAAGPVGGSAAPASSQPAPSETAAVQQPEPTPEPATKDTQWVGTITSIADRTGGTVVTLNTGARCATTREDIVRACAGLKESGAIVELRTRASKKEGNLPVLEEILPVGE